MTLVVAGLRTARTHPDGAGSHLASWLLAEAGRHRGVRVEPGGDHPAVVLLVAQYGAGPSPAVARLVESEDWSGRTVALVAYGKVSRGRDAAQTIAGRLRDAGAGVLDAVLGIHVAVMRRDGGPGVFEELVLGLQLDALAAAVARPSAPR